MAQTIQQIISNAMGVVNGDLSKVSVPLEAQILAELQKQNNKGRPYLYVSDVIALPYTTTTPNATPVMTIVTPPYDMNVDTMALSWDSNAQANYKYLLNIEGVTSGNPTYITFAGFNSNIDIFSKNVVPIPANAQITLQAYNFNSASSNGNVQFYMLGFLQ